MAIAIGETILKSDYDATRTAVINYYRKTKNATPTITAVSIGDAVTAAAVNTLLTAFETADAAYVARACDTNHSGQRRTALYNNRAN